MLRRSDRRDRHMATEISEHSNTSWYVVCLVRRKNPGRTNEIPLYLHQTHFYPFFCHGFFMSDKQMEQIYLCCTRSHNLHCKNEKKYMQFSNRNVIGIWIKSNCKLILYQILCELSVFMHLCMFAMLNNTFKLKIHRFLFLNGAK